LGNAVTGSGKPNGDDGGTLPVDSFIRLGPLPDAEIWTMVAVCSATLTLSRDDTFTLVLWVTKEFWLRGWPSFAELVTDSAPESHVDSVTADFPVHPENTDSEASDGAESSPSE